MTLVVLLEGCPNYNTVFESGYKASGTMHFGFLIVLLAIMKCTCYLSSAIITVLRASQVDVDNPPPPPPPPPPPTIELHGMQYANEPFHPCRHTSIVMQGEVW